MLLNYRQRTRIGQERARLPSSRPGGLSYRHASRPGGPARIASRPGGLSCQVSIETGGRNSPFFFTVARGPVPRERQMARDRHCSSGSPDPERGTRDRCMARDRPSPYGETEAALHTVARGPVPREAWAHRDMARDRPSPYGKRSRSGYRSAGACPPRSSNGEEQTL